MRARDSRTGAGKVQGLVGGSPVEVRGLFGTWKATLFATNF